MTEIKAKSGIPVRGGIARAAAWAWMFKNFSIKNWVQFSEIYGIPFRLGKFSPGTSEPDKDELLKAVVSIASDAGAIIPNNMDITFVETKGASGNSDGGVFGGMARFFDEQTSKVVLGQTGTTDATPGKLGGKSEHQQVREDIERADAKALMAVINRQLIRPFVDLNYGPQPKYPWLWIGRPEAKDAQLQIDAAAKLVPLGWKIRSADLRAVVGFSEPQEGDEVLTAPSVGASLPTGNAISKQDVSAALATARTRAELLAQEMDSGDAIARAAREQDADVMKKAVDQILHAAAISADANEFRRRLQALYASIDTSPLAERLALLTFQALAAGLNGDTLHTQHQAN